MSPPAARTQCVKNFPTAPAHASPVTNVYAEARRVRPDHRYAGWATLGAHPAATEAYRSV